MDRIIEVKVCGNYITKDSMFAGVRNESGVTQLHISFDDSWDKYGKRVVFWDACGENPVKVILTPKHQKGDRDYYVPIPIEALGRAGNMTFCIYGYAGEGDNVTKQVTVSTHLEVKDSGEILAPVQPSYDELAQMQAQLATINDDIHKAIAARAAIENMSVSSQTLNTGEAAFVEKTTISGEGEERVNLHFGLPKGDKGETGDSGVYIGTQKPTEPSVTVWINPDGDSNAASSVVTNVKTFGAVGDGETDDTQALIAAANSGKVVYFPQGTYCLKSTIFVSKSINWIGEGVRSIIQLENGGAETILQHDGTKSYSISLQGLALDANGGDRCLNLIKPAMVYINNVKIAGALNDGCLIDGDDSTDVVISDCRFNENGGSGLYITNVGLDARITNCKFNSNELHGLNLCNNDGAVISNITCNNNGISGVALTGGSSQNTLTGLMCSGAYYGLLLKGTSDARYTDEQYNADTMRYATSNTISGLTTRKNSYGVGFGNSEKTIISGWNSAKDEYGYIACYANTNKNITGTVIRMFDTTKGEGKFPTGTPTSVFDVEMK